MNDERLTIWVRGREALPVRAIPHVTDGQISPLELVKELAQMEKPHIARLQGLVAFRLAGGFPVQVFPSEWDATVIALEGLARIFHE